jgi:methyl-accepting chemotaxis protein
MVNTQPYRRRHFFVKKEYQFKFILKFCLIVLAGTLVSTGLILFFSQGTLTSSFENSRLVVKNTAIAILPAIIYTNIITLLMISVATIVAVLFISHKIAGPMFRFEKELKEIGDGDLTKTIRLRKDDQIKEMAERLNEMTANLHQKILEIQESIERLSGLVREQKSPEELTKELERLQEFINKQFKL